MSIASIDRDHAGDAGQKCRCEAVGLRARAELTCDDDQRGSKSSFSTLITIDVVAPVSVEKHVNHYNNNENNHIPADKFVSRCNCTLNDMDLRKVHKREERTQIDTMWCKPEAIALTPETQHAQGLRRVNMRRCAHEPVS